MTIRMFLFRSCQNCNRRTRKPEGTVEHLQTGESRYIGGGDRFFSGNFCVPECQVEYRENVLDTGRRVPIERSYLVTGKPVDGESLDPHLGIIMAPDVPGGQHQPFPVVAALRSQVPEAIVPKMRAKELDEEEEFDKLVSRFVNSACIKLETFRGNIDMIIVAELLFLDTDYPHLATQQDKKTQFGADAADTGWFRFIVDQHDPWHSEEEESEDEVRS